MHLEKIFELVRREEVVLWVGSGFSLYAGYPTGARLSEIIYQSLSTNEKKEISPNLTLADLSEEFVRIKSDKRKSLNVILEKEFLRPPNAKKWHEILAKIPHIKTIITTNYDKLFELAYKGEIHPIIFSEDVARRSNKPDLFKVHGDINSLNTILITRSDYTDFFYKHTQDNLMWSVIKERISNKHILFIGYDLEDENTKIILRGIADSLGDSKKEMFLIAPNLKAHKVNYLSGLGISYFSFKGEAFVEKLYANIQDRITDDFAKKYVSEETLRKFYKQNNLLVDLKANGDRFHISGVSALNNARPQIEVKFKNDKAFLEPFNAIMEGREFGELLIEGNQLEQFKVLLNQTNIVHDNLAEYYIKIASQPNKEGKFTMIFDDGSEFEDIRYNLFVSKQLVEIVANYKSAKFSIKINGNELTGAGMVVNATIHYEQSRTFDNTNDAISITRFCLNLAEGIGFKLYLDEESECTHLKPGKANFPVERVKGNLDFFESLKKVEKLYNVRFINFLEYSEEDFDSVYRAILLSNGEYHEQEWDNELTWDLDEGVPLEMLLKIEQGAQLAVESTQMDEVTIYGQKIEIGYQVSEPLNLSIINLTEVQEKKTSKVIVKSKSKKIRIHYIRKPLV